jgi:hypothetical protein
MKKTLLTYRITVMVIGILLGVLLLVLGMLLKPETVQTIIKWGIIIYGIFIVIGNIPGLISGIANIGKPTGVFDLVCALLGIALGVAMICYQGSVLVAIVGIYLIILPLVRVLLAKQKGEQFKRELIRIILGVVLLFFVPALLNVAFTVIHWLLVILGWIVIALSVIIGVVEIIRVLRAPATSAGGKIYVDVTGDGVVDTVLVDTDGDGKPDTEYRVDR